MVPEVRETGRSDIGGRSRGYKCDEGIGQRGCSIGLADGVRRGRVGEGGEVRDRDAKLREEVEGQVEETCEGDYVAKNH